MSDQGCPYVAGPTCTDCTGSCWDERPPEPYPEACGGCYMVTGLMQTCDGTCDGLTADNADDRRAQWQEQHPAPSLA